LKKKNTGAIENKRFTENKILFHCPITLNFTNKNEFKINDKVKEYAKKHTMNVIGIDR
jgi:CRISPR-associated protein Cpf1